MVFTSDSYLLITSVQRRHNSELCVLVNTGTDTHIVSTTALPVITVARRQHFIS